MPTRCGTIALLGRPNAGKSTLLNALVGSKLAGVSRKPQTTRNRIAGLLVVEDSQLIFLDTPGMHRTRGHARLNKRMNQEARQVMEEADVLCYLVDGEAGFQPGDQEWLRDLLQRSGAPFAVLLTKADRLKKARLRERQAACAAALEELLEDAGPGGRDRLLWGGVRPVSAKVPDGVRALAADLAGLLPEGPFLYPGDEITDRPLRFVFGEQIRENIFRTMGEEIPYECAVQVEEVAREDGLTRVQAGIIVGRESQKGMIIGKKGSRIRDIGEASRRSMESLTGDRIFLDLRVRVAENWFNDPQLLAEYADYDEDE